MALFPLVSLCFTCNNSHKHFYSTEHTKRERSPVTPPPRARKMAAGRAAAANYASRGAAGPGWPEPRAAPARTCSRLRACAERPRWAGPEPRALIVRRVPPEVALLAAGRCGPGGAVGAGAPFLPRASRRVPFACARLPTGVGAASGRPWRPGLPAGWLVTTCPLLGRGWR